MMSRESVTYLYLFLGGVGGFEICFGIYKLLLRNELDLPLLSLGVVLGLLALVVRSNRHNLSP